jgi:MFS family permease
MPTSFLTPRAALILVFMGFGAIVGCWAGAIPTVSRAAGIGHFELGVGLAISTFATVLVMSCGGLLGRLISYRSLILAALPLAAFATAALLSSSSPGIFVAGMILFGSCIGLLDIAMNAEASAIERDLRRPVFTFFHGALSATMPAFALLSSYVSVRYGLWLTILITLLVALPGLIAVYFAVPARSLAAAPQTGGGLDRHRVVLVLLGLAAGATVSVETSAIFWSAKLLDEIAPALAAISGLGAAFFGVCTAMVRLPGDRLRAKFGEIPLMLGSLILATGGCIALGQTSSFAASVIAFAAIGFGTAILCPCIFAMAANTTPENRAGGIGFVSLVAGAPRIAAPWIFGWVAEGSSIGAAFGLCAALLATAFALLVVLRAMNRRIASAA